MGHDLDENVQVALDALEEGSIDTAFELIRLGLSSKRGGRTMRLVAAAVEAGRRGGHVCYEAGSSHMQQTVWDMMVTIADERSLYIEIPRKWEMRFLYPRHPTHPYGHVIVAILTSHGHGYHDRDDFVDHHIQDVCKHQYAVGVHCLHCAFVDMSRAPHRN